MKKRKTPAVRDKIHRLRKIVFSGVLLTIGLIILASVLSKQTFDPVHKVVFELVGPVERLVLWVSQPFENLKEQYLDLLFVKEENDRLWKEVKESRKIIAKSREALAENVRLRKMLAFKEDSPLTQLAATVIGKDPSLWFRSIIIDRGTSDGINIGDPVVNDEGVVGQIFTCSPHYSKVLLAISPSSAIDVLLQRSRTRGILKGQGGLHKYSLEYIQKSVEIQEGDRVVTAGYGGSFPTGFAVGTISAIRKTSRGMFHEVEVTPSVDYRTLEHLFVILKRQ